MEKLRQQYWTTRQTFRRRLGQKEDEYLVASDAELDMKVQMTSFDNLVSYGRCLSSQRPP
ncbi:hypothetical protein D918_02307 [Trichuris suis]|nr:hypothetical protein D918_02307 [Trichuris suis]